MQSKTPILDAIIIVKNQISFPWSLQDISLDTNQTKSCAS